MGTNDPDDEDRAYGEDRVYDEDRTYDDPIYDEDDGPAARDAGHGDREAVYEDDERIYYDSGDEHTGARRGDEQEGYWGFSLGTLLVLAGLLMFVFPEPVTSGLGVLVAAVGVGVLAAETLD